MRTKLVKCMVAATNASGEPDFYFLKILCTNKEYSDGDHYDTAKRIADENGYTPRLVYDENDLAGLPVEIIFDWNLAPIFKSNQS